MEIRTVLTPAEIAGLPSRDLRGATCVVFDVLRATSTILAALANGARQVFPVLGVEEALALRRDGLPGALLGGERGGVRIENFDLGNSPREYRADLVARREIITTTTNGTVALRACAGAAEVLAGAMVNVAATAAWLRARASAVSTLLLVCAGTGERFALEDGLAAGALATLLEGAPDDATLAMRVLYEQHRGGLEEPLRSSENGRRLVELGLGDDVAWCARESVLDEIAVMRDGAIALIR